MVEAYLKEDEVPLRNRVVEDDLLDGEAPLEDELQVDDAHDALMGTRMVEADLGDDLQQLMQEETDQPLYCPDEDNMVEVYPLVEKVVVPGHDEGNNNWSIYGANVVEDDPPPGLP